MWCHLDSEADARKVITRAAAKKPPNLSIRTWCPTVAYGRRSKVLEAIKEAKESDPRTKYQVRLGKCDIQLWHKQDGWPKWAMLPISELCPNAPPLLEEPWSKEKEEEETAKFLAKRKRGDNTPTKQGQPGQPDPHGYVPDQDSDEESSDQEATQEEGGGGAGGALGSVHTGGPVQSGDGLLQGSSSSTNLDG